MHVFREPHHGDFDATGIAIVRRLHARGCTPWRMGAGDYAGALAVAGALGVELAVDASGCGETPWDGELEGPFDEVRAQVHEELLMEGLLDGEGWTG